ncbi:hypothetical protein MJO28_004037 [Puccinia striiformis f. sp. tritici]|uniref:Uncharacterized protein n=1 Tax=Puccinia striiformis f. sp. tritici TaxID=168172 RepID=A0ACC0EMW9_9BASI|nr:hypothetical protein MJO28_004037 [Puccinia striiformis f. sp. tritici]
MNDSIRYCLNKRTIQSAIVQTNEQFDPLSFERTNDSIRYRSNERFDPLSFERTTNLLPHRLNKQFSTPSFEQTIHYAIIRTNDRLRLCPNKRTTPQDPIQDHHSPQSYGLNSEPNAHPSRANNGTSRNHSALDVETGHSSIKRVRRGKNVKRWALNRNKANAPLEGSTSINQTDQEAEPNNLPASHPTHNNNIQQNQENIYFYYVPPARQEDPNPMDYVAVVNNNGPQMGGAMWADGWRKSYKKESFGWYCSVGKLVKMMRLANYNPQDEASSIKEASDFISIQLQHLAPGVFQHYRETLINNNLPSMAHMEYPLPYDALDFASFLTFTMYNFHNGPHKDTDCNNWTLVCWIPIFNPLNSSDDDPILADDGYDMFGGQFTFRDFQVCLDLHRPDLHHDIGVTLCVFRSNNHTHQTLPGASPSDRYTRIGFSCRMFQAMTQAVVAYINGTAPHLAVAGQEKQISNAQKKL